MPSTCLSWTAWTFGASRSKRGRRRWRACYAGLRRGFASTSISSIRARWSTATPARWGWRASCRSGWARATPRAARATGSSSRTRRRRRREAEEEWGGNDDNEERARPFVQTDQQVSVLKERIARQHEAIKLAKLRGHSTAAAETIQHTLHESLRAF